MVSGVAAAAANIVTSLVSLTHSGPTRNCLHAERIMQSQMATAQPYNWCGGQKQNGAFSAILSDLIIYVGNHGQRKK